MLDIIIDDNSSQTPTPTTDILLNDMDDNSDNPTTQEDNHDNQHSDPGNISINPYYSGCLHQKVPGWTKLRTCGRHDSVKEVGVSCQPPNFESYLEIRIATGNWDSSTALGWLTQIILSEILGIPSSMESGALGSSRDFYDVHGKMDYDRSNSAEPLAIATELEGCDCRSLILPSQQSQQQQQQSLSSASSSESSDYIPCAHFYPEFWGNPVPYIESLQVEPPESIGLLGQESWFVTKFTAQQDSTLVSYHGLQGEANRQKLAATFKRPTTWKQYCEEVAATHTNNCSTPDHVAQRAPETEEEASRMFVEGLYTGHFRLTDANNCNLHPTTCTGHIANYPCGWKSFMEANIYHLDIALDPANGPDHSPGGYTTQQLTDMWHAANATQEHLMMMWWTPEPLYQKFVHTASEMQRVMLKPYTMECEIGRNFSNHEHSQECAEDLYLRVGDPEGACENPTEPLRKLISAGLRDVLEHPDIPSAAQSPAYDALRRFQISEVQLGELFDLWETEATPRDAVCTWAANNLDLLHSTIPMSYPRVAQEEAPSAFGYVALTCGCLATAIVAATAWMVYQHQGKPSIQFAQFDFLSIVLTGSFFVGIGSILLSLPASDGTCLSSVWFVYIGYTLELVPLIVKVAAVNTMMDAARTMRRITLNRAHLFRAVALISLCLIIYMAVWSGKDPPHHATEFSLTEFSTDQGERIVGKTYYCSGNSNIWEYVAVGWNVVLLVGASVLAFQTRNTIKMFNESRTLAFLTYSHFIFVVLRVSTFILENNVRGSILGHVRSVLYAFDQILACGIYFLPKLLASDQPSGSISMGRSTVHLRFDPRPFSSSAEPQSNPFRKREESPNGGGGENIMDAVSLHSGSAPSLDGNKPAVATGEPTSEQPPSQPSIREVEGTAKAEFTI